VPDGGALNVFEVDDVRRILQLPEMMPQDSVPADISASIKYCDPVDAFESVSPCSPAVRVPPQLMTLPPLASFIC
jgi:hypothetical protein